MQYSLHRSGLFVPANRILKTAGWGQLVNADVDTAAAIALSKLAATTAGLVRSNGTVMAGGATVVNADVDAAAAIAITKLAHVGTGNVLRSNGTTNVAGSVATGDIAANAVTQTGLATGTSGTVTTTSGSYSTMTNMSVPLTTTGGDLLVWWVGALAHTNPAAAIVVGLKLDSGAVSFDFSLNALDTAGKTFLAATVGRFTGVTPGPHTVTVEWLTNAATASANGTNRYLLVQELKK